MPWYLIIISFFLNIFFGIFFCYFLLLIFFHPRKRKLLGVKLPFGLLYLLRDKLSNKISEQLTTYIEINHEEFENSKPREFALNFSGKIIGWLNNHIFKYVPEFICEKVRKFITDITLHFARELICVFVPEILERYMIKERILEILSDENIKFVESKAKLYLTKPLVILGGLLGLMFAICNIIYLIII
ncbi:MAG: hypothetical protein U9P79_00080 [Candidatus Cloacimonadota bacterium]|nr:hypothetical protein [Candidatus Cloacimonadota bacterium]